MSVRIEQYLLTAMTSILAIGVLSIALIESDHEDIVETIWAPVFWFCSRVTPVEWQFRGNILLGLSWLFFGVVVYGILCSAVIVQCKKGVKYMRAKAC